MARRRANLQVSGFRFRVSGFGFRASDFDFQVSGFGFLFTGLRVSGFDFGFWISDVQTTGESASRDRVRLQVLGFTFNVLSSRFDIFKLLCFHLFCFCLFRFLGS